MKKYLKIALPLLILAGAAAYTLLPGVRTAADQTARNTKALAAHYELIGGPDALDIRQVITRDSSTSRTIMWQSALPEPEALVEYRLPGAGETTTVPATNETFADDKTTTYIHSSTLTELKPGTKYEYRVGYGDKRSEWQTLVTADRSHVFKALIFPDSQSSDYKVWKETAAPAWKANQDAQFFINMGDLVDNGEDHTQWHTWFDVVDSIHLADKIPMAPVMGNHETYNMEWKVRQPVAYLHMFTLPKVNLEQYQNQFYSFDYGEVHFTVLNTQLEEMTQFQPDLVKDELEWLKQDLSSTRQKWKVVLMHKDVLQYSFNNRPEPRPEGISKEGQRFMPLFDQFKVDVVLTAHLHTYRNRGHIENFKRSDQGPLYIITGVAGNVRYPGLWKKHSLDVTIAPQPETDNYLTLEAGSDFLRFNAFLPDGERIDTVEVKK
jgi:phosphodiesterase/alkaline phosphatase D-like protein